MRTDTNRYRRAVLGSVGAIAIYALAAFAGLRDGTADAPWRRLDVFSASALSLNAIVVAQQAGLWFRLRRSRESVLELFGVTYDPGMGRGMLVLLALESLAFFDYGRGRIAPVLRQAPLQMVGLLLAGASLLIVAAADRRLIAHFVGGPATGKPITTGAYGRVRHPRYAGLLLSRAALALLLGSAPAALLVPAWWLLVRRRIRREEAHLRERYGEAYAAYAGRLPALWPRGPFRAPSRWP